MAKFLFPIPQWFLSSGVVNAGGLIQTYAAGTVTPLATWSESTGTSLNPNPVVLDSAGRAQIWLSAAAYKFVIQTSAGATIMTIDGYNPDTLNTTVSSLTSTGDIISQQPTAATGSANQSSNNVKIQATYWDGAASQIDQWNIQDVLGTGSNPTSTLTVTHSGSSGTVTLSVPSAPVSIGSTLTVAGAVTASTSVTTPALISSTANPASAGAVRLANTDAIKWRNNANGGDVALQKTGAVAGAVPADTLDASGLGGVLTPLIVSTSANPSTTGNVRLASGDTIQFRNNANSGNIPLAKTGAVSGSIPADSLNISGFGGLVMSGPINGASYFGTTFSKQVFTGNGTFTIPSGVSSVRVMVVGGGGAGGGSTASTSGAGGGSGGTSIKWLSGLTPGNTIAVTVGSGGTGVSAGNGNSGGASSIASGTQTITTVTANGGGGGLNNSGIAGIGASVGTNGDVNYGGNPGQGSFTAPVGGNGGGSIFGGGGSAGTGIGAAGSAPGAGGAGSGDGAGTAVGGAGAAGTVIFEWVQ